MAKTTFAVPIAPGKTEAWKQAIAEINGARRSGYLEARKSLGITKEVASLQQTPQGDLAVVYIEAEDVTNILQRMVDATDSFSQWFSQTILRDIHGLDLSHGAPPANQVFIDLL